MSKEWYNMQESCSEANHFILFTYQYSIGRIHVDSETSDLQ
jgi:hypothetical protein